MARCPNCGAESVGNRKFCGKCGTKLEVREIAPDHQGVAEPREMPQAKGTLKGKKWIIAVIAAVVVAAVAVGAFAIINGKNADQSKVANETESTAQNDTADTKQEAAEEQSAGNVYTAYGDVLKDNESAIRKYSAQQGSTDKCVVMSDLSGDGVPELLFFSGEGLSPLRAFTYVDGQAIECSYDDSLMKGEISSNDRLFEDAFTAGGTKYMVYTGKSPGTFYVAYGITDQSTHCYSIRYKFSGNSAIKMDKVVKNKYTPPMDGSGEVDDYFLNGSGISIEKASAELKADREDFDKLLMCKGYVEDLKVFELTRKNTNAALTFDDAIDACNIL